MVRSAFISMLASLALAGPVSAQRLVTIAGAPGPGPAQFNRVFVEKFGPSKARNVLVLVPGTSAGAGDFTLIARELVKRVPNLQVWAQDRREQALEDTSFFRQTLLRRHTLQDALSYYLGWIAHPEVTSHYQPLRDADYPFVRQWGLSVAMNDLRRVVLAARDHGRRRVILGGHSLGGSETVAYATWDFAGRPGFRDLSGLVLIDGGLLRSFGPSLTPADARAQLAAINSGSPFLDLLGVGLPWVSGAFAELAGIAAEQAPHDPSLLGTFPLLPASFRTPVPATNLGQLGFAFDYRTSPKSLALIQVHSGSLTAGGEWSDTGITPIERLAQTFGQEPSNGVDWYYPRRLSLDAQGASDLTRGPLSTLLGLRTWHLRAVNLPLYAFQTSLSAGGVLAGARNFALRSKIGLRRATLVDASKTTSHLDPLLATPGKNLFARTVEPFLRKLVR